MYKIIALIGKAGSGKDTLLHLLRKQYPQYNFIITSTTRPKREYEVNGKDYFFYDKTEINNLKFAEKTMFNDWIYGTQYSSLKEDTINIGVFNPSAIKQLVNNKNIDLKVIFVQAKDKTRLLRQLNRENDPNVFEIVRRFTTDEQDFENLNFLYYVFNNEVLEDQVSFPSVIAEKLANWLSQDSSN